MEPPDIAPLDMEPPDIEPLVIAALCFFLPFILSWSDMAPLDIEPLAIAPSDLALLDIAPLDMAPPDAACASAEPATPKLMNRARAAVFPKFFIGLSSKSR